MRYSVVVYRRSMCFDILGRYRVAFEQLLSFDVRIKRGNFFKCRKRLRWNHNKNVSTSYTKALWIKTHRKSRRDCCSKNVQVASHYIDCAAFQNHHHSTLKVLFPFLLLLLLLVMVFFSSFALQATLIPKCSHSYSYLLFCGFIEPKHLQTKEDTKVINR